MSEHTLGPWVVNCFGADWRVIARTQGGVAISAVSPKGDEISNARLIAAAPDLLDAAVWVLHNAHGISRSGEDGVSAEEESASWAALMAAVEKADGK